MDKGRRLAVVTGATGAIGAAIARQLAQRSEFEVFLVCRDAGRAERSVEAIRRATGNARVRYELADLSRRASVQALCRRLEGGVDVLINNAVIAPRRREETPEGIELQFATNVLGYVWMMEGLRDHLKRGAPSRVVNVASYWAGGLQLDDLEFKRRRYDNNAAYRQSKQANRMLSAAYAEHLAADGIWVNACHSGDVNSKVSNSLGFGGSESPDQGARTPIWLATGEAGGISRGCYFEHEREVPCRFSRDRDAVQSLYHACQEYS